MLAGFATPFLRTLDEKMGSLERVSVPTGEECPTCGKPLVERSSRFTMLLHVPPMADQGLRVHNGPALAGHGAEAVRDAIARAIVT